jgi:hypothetical protein
VRRKPPNPAQQGAADSDRNNFSPDPLVFVPLLPVTGDFSGLSTEGTRRSAKVSAPLLSLIQFTYVGLFQVLYNSILVVVSLDCNLGFVYGWAVLIFCDRGLGVDYWSDL